MLHTTGTDITYHSPALALPPIGRTATTAKQTSRALRVWLENKTMLEGAGFHAGACYDAAYYPAGYVVLTLNADGACKVSSCKRGDAVRPIIDLHSKALADIFTAGTVLEVQYMAGAIIIKAAY